MIAELVVFAVILAVVGYIYLSGTLIKSFMLLISAIVASVIAFAFFEITGRIVIGYGYGGEWAFGGTFALIFVIVFALLNVMTDQLAPIDTYLGDLPDRVGRSIFAAIAGFVIAGVILIIASMLPIPEKWPYERFSAEGNISRPTEADKTLFLGADGFVTNFCSWISKGSMSGKKSMAVFHPDFLNEMALNRIRKDENNKIIAGSQGIEVKAAWFAPTELVSDSDKQPISGGGAGKKAVIVRAGISGMSIKDGGTTSENGITTFTMAQVRLSCKKNDSAESLAGEAEVCYPIGFIKSENITKQVKLTEETKLDSSSFSGGTKWYDFVFFVPADTTPVVLEFKMNAADSIDRLVSGEKIPAPL